MAAAAFEGPATTPTPTKAEPVSGKADEDDEDDDDEEEGYQLRPDGFYLRRRVKGGITSQRLTNWTARIVADLLEDDGRETRRTFEVEASVEGGAPVTFEVEARDFDALGWRAEHLGARAVVYPGGLATQHTTTAIRELGAPPKPRRIFLHTGWREREGEPVYLHAGGAIGAGGVVDGVEVRLPTVLERFDLPTPPEGEALREAVRSSLRVLDVAPRRITVPVYAGLWRAVLDTCPVSAFVSGRTNSGKSVLAALVQAHHGAGLDYRHLPAGWESTENALEGLAFAAKDALLVIDDFKPSGVPSDDRVLNRKADRVLRGQGNGAGRLRMNRSARLQDPKHPRGLILATGEDLPRGESLRTRMVVVELGPGETDWERVSDCQRDADAGRYAEALAGFVRWLAPRLGKVRDWLRGRVVELREEFGGEVHRRTPEAVAELFAGLEVFARFAEDVGALGADDAARFLTHARAALQDAVIGQADLQRDTDPVDRFTQLLAEALSSGRAYVAGAKDVEPDDPGAWGWRERPQAENLPEGSVTWEPKGERIGWVEDGELYLLPDVAHGVAQGLAREDPLAVSRQTLGRRLRERGLLRTVRDGRLTCQRRIGAGGRQVSVWHLGAGLIDGV